MPQSTRQKRSSTAGQAPADFPLTKHPNGQFSKKCRGKVYYFGQQSAGWQPAVKKFHEDWPEILKHGTKPIPATLPEDDAALTLVEGVNIFLTAKKQLADNGELVMRTVSDYRITSGKVLDCLGYETVVEDLAPRDFEKLRRHLAKGRNATSLSNEIVRCRVLLKFLFDQEYISKPARYGQGFNRPSAKVRRKLRSEQQIKHGKRMLEAKDIRLILEHASQPLRAMILLAANCGFGQTDLSNLPISAIDLKDGWVDFPRRKTWVDRRCRLWPETLAAVKEWIPQNPTPKDPEHNGLLFVTRCGAQWTRLNEKGSPYDGISGEFNKLLVKLKLKRHGLGFYCLRHGFLTIGEGCLDTKAVGAIMGHVDSSMAASYTEEIADDRLTAVADYVHNWLFPL